MSPSTRHANSQVAAHAPIVMIAGKGKPLPSAAPSAAHRLCLDSFRAHRQRLRADARVACGGKSPAHESTRHRRNDLLCGRAHRPRTRASRDISGRALHRIPRPNSCAAGLTYESTLGDVTDLDALRTAIAGCDWVFHVAAVADYWRAEKRACTRSTSKERARASGRPRKWRQARRVHQQRCRDRPPL